VKTRLFMAVFLGVLSVNSAFCDELHGSIKIPFFKSEKSVIRKVQISMIHAIKTAKTRAPGQVIKAKIAGCSSTMDIPPAQSAKKENHRQEEAREGELWQSPRFILRLQEAEEERQETQQ